MKKGMCVSLIALLVMVFSAQVVFAQSGSVTPANAKPIELSSIKLQFRRMNKLAPETKAALQTDADINGNASTTNNNSSGIRTIPHWHGSFTYKGKAYPYIMAGQNPRQGGSTTIGTQLIPVNVVLDGCTDAQGNPVAFNVDKATINNVLNSPEFESASFSSGFTQFTDAVQRAEFHSVAKEDWHTVLGDPKILEPVTIEVPPEDSACLFIPPNGKPFADVDIDYFSGQMETILELENVDPTALSIVLTKDMTLYFNFNPLNCCIIGFHSAGAVLGVVGNPAQTWAWASWLSPADNFGGGFEDILPLSHEVGEWANDPYTNNVVPPWQVPDGSGNCGGNLLEVGDPVEVLAEAAFPVVVDGYTYHPQTLALLQWFSREHPSSAIDGAYSYPNIRALPAPSVACK